MLKYETRHDSDREDRQYHRQRTGDNHQFRKEGDSCGVRKRFHNNYRNGGRNFGYVNKRGNLNGFNAGNRVNESYGNGGRMNELRNSSGNFRNADADRRNGGYSQNGGLRDRNYSSFRQLDVCETSTDSLCKIVLVDVQRG